MEDIREKVEKIMEKIRPALQADGGDVELISVVEGIVTVALKGACTGCPASQMTLQMGIEEALKGEIPEIKKVVALRARAARPFL